jgi:hypothetical protein
MRSSDLGATRDEVAIGPAGTKAVTAERASARITERNIVTEEMIKILGSAHFKHKHSKE